MTEHGYLWIENYFTQNYVNRVTDGLNGFKSDIIIFGTHKFGWPKLADILRRLAEILARFSSLKIRITIFSNKKVKCNIVHIF